jgi:hypothetical protein
MHAHTDDFQAQVPRKRDTMLHDILREKIENVVKLFLCISVLAI